MKPLSDLLEKVKQIADNKQTADILKILNFYSQHLCYEQFHGLKPLKGIFGKSKPTAESKQTADHLKNCKFPFQTTLL